MAEQLLCPWISNTRTLAYNDSLGENIAQITILQVDLHMEINVSKNTVRKKN